MSLHARTVGSDLVCLDALDSFGSFAMVLLKSLCKYSFAFSVVLLALYSRSFCATKCASHTPRIRRVCDAWLTDVIRGIWLYLLTVRSLYTYLSNLCVFAHTVTIIVPWLSIHFSWMHGFCYIVLQVNLAWCNRRSSISMDNRNSTLATIPILRRKSSRTSSRLVPRTLVRPFVSLEWRPYKINLGGRRLEGYGVGGHGHYENLNFCSSLLFFFFFFRRLLFRHCRQFSATSVFHWLWIW